ncbi:uncharacterized protein B0J16DRAFT_127587 [Fusarium flagelliforme]|uniref:uncharacterized protein n=1 Tax=Fusarium flagelliforme TaxID=2675880 RepID=UPI001E8E863E|nr:uncharacterized protein B0J16DRAFT_127587 [Fusarium flagelliforme]KAH7185298.1 hypothetical protein B0J16DRAFT_127587 [Fusarium flagelliforme]
MHAAAVSAARRREQAQDPRPRSNRSKNLKTFRPQCNVVVCSVYYCILSVPNRRDRRPGTLARSFQPLIGLPCPALLCSVLFCCTVIVQYCTRLFPLLAMTISSQDYGYWAGIGYDVLGSAISRLSVPSCQLLRTIYVHPHHDFPKRAFTNFNHYLLTYCTVFLNAHNVCLPSLG